MDDLKQKISVLWIFFALMMTVHYVMYIFEPGALQQVNAGVIVLSPALAILELFVNWFIPLTMAFLTLSLKDDLNRRVNTTALRKQDHRKGRTQSKRNPAQTGAYRP